jgi:magnesium chelatase subunit D
VNAAADAALVASLFAVDPYGVGGVCLHSQPQPAREQWLELMRYLLPAVTPLRRIPFNISDARMFGGLDLPATVRANRPVAERGVLALSHGGVVIVAMAERLSAHTAASLNAMLDMGEINLARDGVRLNDEAQVGVVALDEGMGDEECTPHSLLDRMAFLLDFSSFSIRTLITPAHEPYQILNARTLLPHVENNSEVLAALCATALGMGAGSPRVSILALRVARIAAALEGRRTMTPEDAITAARLVLAPRATVAPPLQDASTAEESVSEPPPGESDSTSPDSSDASAQASGDSAENTLTDNPPLKDRILAAAAASIPSGLLARLRSAAVHERAARRGAMGKSGGLRKTGARGRPAGVRTGVPGSARLNIIETLRAAAPWQRIRSRTAAADSRMRIRPEDFRITRYKQRSQTLTIFAVDASGSSALNRLAEAKGAVELLLADCYIRRDQVAVIAFRGTTAQTLLPPTRSLVRAKRSLAGLPGGGGTPLAAAIDAARRLAVQAARRGESATLVLLTDGRANVARGGETGRDAGRADALAAALAFRATRTLALFIDTSPRGEPSAKSLALHMGAQYIPLPFANAQSLSNIVMTATQRQAK